MSDFTDIYESILEEGTRKFSRAKPSDRKLYGKIHGKDELLAYAKYIDPGFIDPHHLKLIAEKLALVEQGKITRLMINVPPRFGKTYLASKIFPSWYRGRHSRNEVIQTSYSTTRAESYTRWVRDTCESDAYHAIFPDVLVRRDKRAAGEWYTEDSGVHIGAGAGGGITGTGAHLAIIDDPVKDYEEAISAVIQDKIWDWYLSTLFTRLYVNAPLIVIMTRWVTDDLCGRLIEHEGLIEDGGKWDRLKLPILDAHGKSLWPERYSEDEIQKIREAVGEKIFQALYMQEPVDAVERLFSDPKFGEAPRGLKLVAFLDPAFGGADYSAFTAGGIDREKSDEGLIHIARGHIWRGSIDITYDKVEKYCKELGISVLFVESNQAQTAVAHEFRRRGIIVKEIASTVAKHVRIQNHVKLNWDRIRFSRAVDQDYLKQVLLYSELARHDDAPDSLAGLIAVLGPWKGNIEKRYAGFAGLLRRW